MLQLCVPLWRVHLSPRVSHVHQHTRGWLGHRRLLSSCVFSGHSGGISVKVYNIEMRFHALCLDCAGVLLLPPSCLVFQASLRTAFRKGTLANGINRPLVLKASPCLRREQKEDPSETSGAFAHTAPAPAWPNTEKPPQSDIAFICLRRGRFKKKKIIGCPRRESVNVQSGLQSAAATTGLLLIVTAAHFCPTQIRSRGPLLSPAPLVILRHL